MSAYLLQGSSKAVVLAVHHARDGVSLTQYSHTAYMEPNGSGLALWHVAIVTVYLSVHLPSTGSPIAWVLVLGHATGGISPCPLTALRTQRHWS